MLPRRQLLKLGAAGITAAIATPTLNADDLNDPNEKSFQDVGLPDGHAYPKLFYHHATETLIVQTEPRDKVLTTKRLSYRRLIDREYRSVCCHENDISVESVALAPTKPSIYFTTNRLHAMEDRLTGQNWAGLWQFDPSSREAKEIVTEANLVTPDSYRRSWINVLLGVSNDGTTLYCVAALERETVQFALVTQYWVANLDLLTFKIQPITQLEATFA